MLEKMTSYQEVRVKLTNTQLNKLKSAMKNKTGKILKTNKKTSKDEGFLHELFLIIRKTNGTRNAFANDMTIDIKLSKAQISKIIQPGVSFSFWLVNLGTEVLKNIAIPLAKDNLLD